jgi:hypothetical protein
VAHHPPVRHRNKTFYGAWPGAPQNSMRHRIAFWCATNEPFPTSASICPDDIIRLFVSRRVLPLQRRIHKIGQMCDGGIRQGSLPSVCQSLTWSSRPGRFASPRCRISGNGASNLSAAIAPLLLK